MKDEFQKLLNEKSSSEIYIEKAQIASCQGSLCTSLKINVEVTLGRTWTSDNMAR